MPVRVLCVDDQPAVAKVAEAVLIDAGFSVTTMTSPEAALELFEGDPAAYDVIVTDQTMPTMKGLALIAALRALRPGLPCVLMTGLCNAETTGQAEMLGVNEILAKPFTLETLVAAVRRVSGDSKP